jgi:SAM-dependent methyltransferase
VFIAEAQLHGTRQYPDSDFENVNQAIDLWLDTAREFNDPIPEAIPKSGAIRLLEVGCGSACYIYYAATRNPTLHALRIELQPEVAQIARSNIQQWSLGDRVAIEVDDIRDRTPVPEFDLVTLYNIYYFPFDERVSLLIHLKKFIKPDGFLLLRTSCQGGNLGFEVLNL